MRGLSLAAVSRCCSLAAASHRCGFRHLGFSSCNMRAQELQLTGSVAPRQVESFWTRDQSHAPAWAGGIPIHGITREALKEHFTREKNLKPGWAFPGACLCGLTHPVAALDVHSLRTQAMFLQVRVDHPNGPFQHFARFPVLPP